MTLEDYLKTIQESPEDSAPVARDAMGEVMESDDDFLVVPSKIKEGKHHPLKRRWPDGTEKTDAELEEARDRADNALMSRSGVQYSSDGQGFEDVKAKRPSGDYSKGEAAATGFVDGITDTVGLVGRGTANLLGKAGVLNERQVRDTNEIIRGGLASGAINALAGPGGFEQEVMIRQNPMTYTGTVLAGGLGDALLTLPASAGTAAKAGGALTKGGRFVKTALGAEKLGDAISGAGKAANLAGKFRMVEMAPKIKIAKDAGFLTKNASKAANSASKVLTSGAENVIQGAPITASRAALEYTHGAPDAGEAMAKQTAIDFAAPAVFKAIAKPVQAAAKVANGKDAAARIRTSEDNFGPFTIDNRSKSFELFNKKKP